MREVGLAGKLAALILAGALAFAVASPLAAAEAEAEARAGERLSRVIQRALRAEGPFFTAAERQVIERHCGYAAGSWDGFEANMQDGVFVCRDGRRVDHPELRAVMAEAGPRIGRRVSAAMASPEVRAAIEQVTRAAEARARQAVAQALQHR